MDNQDRVARNVVILIHGTWGRGFFMPLRRAAADWCQENSKLRASVSDALGEVVTTFHVFKWSGANSPWARLRAARSLREELLHLREKYPNARLHLIAHSHGGNIAFYSSAHPDLIDQINSVICLSTPFIHVKPRNLGVTLGRKLEMLASILVFLSAAILFRGSLVRYVDELQLNFGELFLPTIASALLLAISWQMLTFMWRKIHAWSHRFADRMALPEKLPFPVLILRGAADEAASALGATVLLTSVLDRALRMLLSLVPVLRPSDLSRTQKRNFRKVLFACCFGVVIGSILFIIGVGESKELLKNIYIVGVGLVSLGLGTLVLILVVVLAATLLAWFSGVLKILAVLPFGPGFALASLGVQISAESTPPGRWTVLQLSPGSTTLQDENGLRHFTHSNPEALKIVHDWLRRRFSGTSRMQRVSSVRSLRKRHSQ